MRFIEKCTICGSKTNEIYSIKFTGLLGLREEYEEKIGYCNNCGFLFNSNPFDKNQLDNRYKNLSKYEYDIHPDNYVEQKDFVIRSNIQKNFIYENCDDFDSVLEVGAASGYNLSLYKKDKKEVYGIEPSRTNKLLAMKKYGVEIYDGTFEEYIERKQLDKKYDLIFLSNILEHIINPIRFIQNLKNICNKYIFIEVPTFDYKFSDECFGMFSDEHLNYFTFESIQNMMTKCDYSLVNSRIEFYLNCYNASGTPSLLTLWKKDKEISSRKIINHSIDVFHRYIKDSERKLSEINSIINNIDDNVKIAIWGTGSHTARLLASTNLRNKNIVKFYDSDIKKHKYKILGKDIMSFNGSDIDNGIVDIIIISTYVSQEVIYNSIDDKYKNNIIKLYNS